VIEARDLKAADFGGTSDPYCELRVVSMAPTQGTVQRTRVIPKTLCPIWNEEFHL
jgi:Ca2+-dependent lipid-binding protein